MPKHLVTAIGLVVSLGVIAMGVSLVALPVYLQAVGVGAQTTTVANTNAAYQAQVDSLHAQQENLDAINANVAQLRSQIPATGQLDDVFEVVARAAEASGISITAVTAGEQVAFAARAGVTEGDGTATAPAPEPTPVPTTGAADSITGAPTVAPDAAAEGATSGRQQVDFAISATAADMEQATVFLDALRDGPRLLSSITATTNQSGEGSFDMQISALTYLDAEG